VNCQDEIASDSRIATQRVRRFGDFWPVSNSAPRAAPGTAADLI